MVIRPAFSRQPTCLFLLTVLVTCASGIAFGQTTASLNTNTVSEYQSVTLKIEDRSNGSAEPDLSALQQDFEISGTSSQSSVSIINGRFESSRSWQVELMPKRTGRIEIPPIPVGNTQTNPLQLTVRAISSAERQQISSAAFMDTTISHMEQYPQAAIYVSRQLFYSNQVSRIPSLPQEKPLEVEGASVFPLGSREMTRQIRNSVEYVVVQWNYVVFAEKSGELRIPGDAIRVGLRSSRVRSSLATVSAEEKTIRILPIPSEYPKEHPWFPASNVEITQTFDPVDIGILNLGDAVKRTISLNAQNSYESALVPMEFEESPGLRVYPEQTSKESVAQNGEVWGKATRSFNLLPIEAGNLQIPEFSVVWWDIEDQAVRTTSVRGQSVSVLSDSTIANPIPQALSADQVVQSDSLGEASTDVSSTAWFYPLVITATTGWLAALVLLFMHLLRHFKQSSTLSPQKTINYRGLSQAIASGDPVLIKQQISRSVADRLDITTLKAIRLIRTDPYGQELVDELDGNAYGNSVKLESIEFKKVKQLIDNIVNNQNTLEGNRSLMQEFA